MSNNLLIEPFYSGSHKVLMDMLHEALMEKGSEGVKVHLATLPGKKWHWRARTSALYFSQTIPMDNYKCIFTSCVLPLHELLGLRPDLQTALKIIYFHENQLVYPVRKSKERDFQYGYNQILSCLAADKVWFNSKFNQESFLSNLQKFFKLQPDFRPKNLREQIEHKCSVKYFPMDFAKIGESVTSNYSLPTAPEEERPLRIVWPHRWEFDKNPELFFRVLFRLVDSGVHNFRLIVCGESFTDNPPIFNEAKIRLKDFIDHFGHLPSKTEYYNALAESDVVISTSDHEFFGVSIMEAVYLKCMPICPNNLVYPELYNDAEFLYNDENDLYTKLRTLCISPSKRKLPTIYFNLYNWDVLKYEYLKDFLKS